jgi:hypothetical protein
MPRVGGIDGLGQFVNVMRYTGTAEKIGIEFDYLTAGAYKSSFHSVGAGPAPDALHDSADRIIHAAGRVVMPGMTNAHTHLFQTFFRGLADDKPLLEWIADCIWPAAVHLDRYSAHLAAMVGTPVVALFGPTDPVRTTPLGASHIVLSRKLHCSPCMEPHCPLQHHACLRELDEDLAFDALQEILGSRATA